MPLVIKIPKKIAASNKNQTHQEKPKQKGEGGPAPAPFIDKISIVVTFSQEDAAPIFDAFWMAIADKSVFNDTGSKAKGGYDVAKWLNLASTPARVLFQFKHEAKEAVKCRFEFNPRKLGKSGFDDLRSIVVSLMPDGWEYVIKHGRVTRIDVAVDIPNARPENYAILPQQGLTTQKWAVNGKLQTFVLGTKKGNQTLLYNKKAQRLSQGKKWPGKATVRIERRLRHPSPSKLSSLHKLPNPFLVAKLLKMPGPPVSEKKPYMWSLFTDSVSVRGLPAALKLLPAEKRTAYRKHLSSIKDELWTPDQIWSEWPAYLAECKLHRP